jgi:tetratricopeptide (TPR) repeat protein
MFQSLGAELLGPFGTVSSLLQYLLLQRRRKQTYFLPAGGSSPLGVVGFVNAAFELKSQIFDDIWNAHPKEQDIIKMYGKEVKVPRFNQMYGHAYRFLGRYDEAIAVYQKAIQLSPKNLIAHLGLTCTYSLSGRDKEASAHATEILRISPEFSLDRLQRNFPSKPSGERALH